MKPEKSTKKTILKDPKKRNEPMSFMTFLVVKKKLQKLAKIGNRSMSREMERLVREAPL